MAEFYRFARMANDDGYRLDVAGMLIPNKPWWDDEGRYCASADFKKELAAIDGEKLTIVIDSQGGDCGAGMAMYEEIRQRKGETHAVVIRAYSAATLVLAACDKGRRQISPVGSVMIHNPVASASGDRRELQRAQDFLRVIEDAALAAYVEATGKNQEDLRALMDAETWWNAQEAIANGFADSVLPAQQSALMCAPYASASNEATSNMIQAAIAAEQDTEVERNQIIAYLESIKRG